MATEETYEDEDVLDEAESDETVVPEPYNITSFGADYDVEGIVRRLRKKEILIPPFQRDYVWNQKDASRFIESLLLGLPVPGVFLASDPERKFLVIDGQQRLRTLEFFYDGFFNPRPHEKSHRVFKLVGVQPQFESLTYNQLEEKDRLRLDNSIIHSTIVKQETPQDDDTSVFHIFERLNNGGRKLTDQEIRVALYHGSFVERIEQANTNADWREIFGPPSQRLKDREFILRFLGLYEWGERYKKPMKEFLNKFAARHRKADEQVLAKWEQLFSTTMAAIWQALGKSAFRPTGALNAAVFDSVMVGVASRTAQRPLTDHEGLADAYMALVSDSTYLDAVSRATSDETAVGTRLRMAKEAFQGLE